MCIVYLIAVPEHLDGKRRPLVAEDFEHCVRQAGLGLGSKVEAEMATAL